MDRPPSLHKQVIQAAPRGFSRPLSHADYFTEPLELASGLANLDGPGKPGTYGTCRGTLRKVKDKSSLNAQRWHNPAGQSRAERTDKLLRGKLAVILAHGQPIACQRVPAAPQRPATPYRSAPPPALPILRTRRPEPALPVPPPAEPAPPPRWRTLALQPPANPTRVAASSGSAWGASSISLWEVQHDLAYLSPASKRRPAA